MYQWSHRLHAVNKSSGHRWSPIPKPPPPHVDRLCGTHSVLNTLRVFYLSAGQQHPHRRQLRRLFVRDFRLAQNSVEETINNNNNNDDEDNNNNTTTNNNNNNSKSSNSVRHREKTPMMKDGNSHEITNDIISVDSHTNANNNNSDDNKDAVWVPPQYINLRRIVKIARAMQMDVQCVERRELVQLCGERRNQNVVLEVSSFTPKEVVASPWYTRNTIHHNRNEKEPITNNNNDNDDVILFLDHIIDPGNVGAIMRSAFFLGIQRVVLSCDSAGCTPAVSRSSAGFVEHMNIYRSVVPTVTFLENTIAQHKARVNNNSYKLEVYAAIATPWGTTVSDNNNNNNNIKQEEGDNKKEKEKERPRRRLVLLGNEDKGLPTEIVRLCTHSVHIPSLRRKQQEQQENIRSSEEKAVYNAAVLKPQEVSLNVSTASAVILTELLAGRHAVEVRPIR